MRRGAALTMVLFVLALTSGLAVGGAFVTRRLVATARQSNRSSDLESAAEGAILDAVARWDTVARRTQGVGATELLEPADQLGVRSETWVTRVGSTTYWIVSESRTQSAPVLRRRIGLAVQVLRGRVGAIPSRGWSELP